MMKLFDNAFSPFARKVRIALELKAVEVEIVDGLDRRNAAQLESVNGRVEVPTLVDGDAHDAVVVVGSSDIIAYLERVSPETPLYPASGAEFVRARAWERCADTVVDAILTDISLWSWAERPDSMPAGLLDAARADLDRVYAALAEELRDREYVCGSLSIADVALFPHLNAARGLGAGFDAGKHPELLAWLRRLRAQPVFAQDLERAKAYMQSVVTSGGANVERKRIFWRGDRIEWILARGFAPWFMDEIAADRVLWPGLGIPNPH